MDIKALSTKSFARFDLTRVPSPCFVVDEVAVERNLELAPRTRHAETRLAPGDRVDIVTLVGGG